MCRGGGSDFFPPTSLTHMCISMKHFESSLVSLWPKFDASVFLKLKKKSQAAPLAAVLGVWVWGIFPGAPQDFLRMLCKMVSIWEMMRKLLASSNCRASCRQFSCNQFRAALVMWPIHMLEVTCVTLILRWVVTGAAAGGWNEYLRTWKT